MKKWILVAGLTLTGCISSSEYSAFVDAADKYNKLVSDHYIELLSKSENVNSQTVINRRDAVARFTSAIEAAKDRLGQK